MYQRRDRAWHGTRGAQPALQVPEPGRYKRRTKGMVLVPQYSHGSQQLEKCRQRIKNRRILFCNGMPKSPMLNLQRRGVRSTRATQSRPWRTLAPGLCCPPRYRLLAPTNPLHGPRSWAQPYLGEPGCLDAWQALGSASCEQVQVGPPFLYDNNRSFSRRLAVSHSPARLARLNTHASSPVHNRHRPAPSTLAPHLTR